MSLHRNNPLVKLGAFLTIGSLAACSGSSIQQSIEPTIKSSNPIADSTLQFAVGTANIAGVVGLNTLVTLRQTGADGTYKGASVLSNAPTITGPAGFVVPAAPDAYGDSGKDMISAHIVTSLSSPPPQTTFDPNAGLATGPAQGNYLASAYGFFPGVVGEEDTAPELHPGTNPFYSSENAALKASNAAFPALPAGNALEAPGGGGPFYYIGGPPAFVPAGHTSTQDGTFAAGDYGFTLGFTDFQATPTSGTYALNVVIPTGINSTTGAESYGNKAATAALTATTVLPGWTTAPTFVSNGMGGGGVTEEYIELEDLGNPYMSGMTVANAGYGCMQSGSAPYFYTIKVTPGTASVTVPNDIGAANPGKTQGHTFCTATDNAPLATSANSGATTPVVTNSGDMVLVYGFGVDYPLFNSAIPQSAGVVAPIITATGQDDVTSSSGSIASE